MDVPIVKICRISNSAEYIELCRIYQIVQNSWDQLFANINSMYWKEVCTLLHKKPFLPSVSVTLSSRPRKFVQWDPKPWWPLTAQQPTPAYPFFKWFLSSKLRNFRLLVISSNYSYLVAISLPNQIVLNNKCWSENLYIPNCYREIIFIRYSIL